MKRLSVMGTAALALVLGMAAAQATPRIHPAQASDLTTARGSADISAARNLTAAYKAEKRKMGVAATTVSGASARAITVDCAKKKKTR